MKASEVIAGLQTLLAEHGDLEVYLLDREDCWRESFEVELADPNSGEDFGRQWYRYGVPKLSKGFGIA